VTSPAPHIELWRLGDLARNPAVPLDDREFVTALETVLYNHELNEARRQGRDLHEVTILPDGNELLTSLDFYHRYKTMVHQVVQQSIADEKTALLQRSELISALGEYKDADAEGRCLLKILDDKYDTQHVPSAAALLNSEKARTNLRKNGQYMMAQVLEVLAGAFAALDTHGLTRTERMKNLDLAYIMFRNIIGDGMHTVQIDQADRRLRVMGFSYDVITTLMQHIDVLRSLLASHPNMAVFLRETGVSSDSCENFFSLVWQYSIGVKPTKDGMIACVKKVEFVRKLRTQRGLGFVVRDGSKARYMHNKATGWKCARWNGPRKERVAPLWEQPPEMLVYRDKILRRAMNSTGTGTSYSGLRTKEFKKHHHYALCSPSGRTCIHVAHRW